MHLHQDQARIKTDSESKREIIGKRCTNVNKSTLARGIWRKEGGSDVK